MQTVSFVFPDFSTNISVYAPEFSRPTEHSLRAVFFTALTYFDILLTLYTYGIFLPKNNAVEENDRKSPSNPSQ